MKNSQSKTFSFGEVELSYKKKQSSTFKTIKSSDDAVTYIREIFPIEQICYREHMYALYLDNSNCIIGYHLLSIGGITGTFVDIRVLMQGALLTNAVGLLLFHNHPSNKLKPSNADRKITDKIIRSAEVLDIKLLDHIIITEDGYYSFADNGDL